MKASFAIALLCALFVASTASAAPPGGNPSASAGSFPRGGQTYAAPYSKPGTGQGFGLPYQPEFIAPPPGAYRIRPFKALTYKERELLRLRQEAIKWKRLDGGTLSLDNHARLQAKFERIESESN